MTAELRANHDFALTVAGLAGGFDWLYADEMRGRLRTLFDLRLSAQQVVGALIRMTKEDAPRFERERASWGREWRYRATRYAATDLENKLPNLRLRERVA